MCPSIQPAPGMPSAVLSFRWIPLGLPSSPPASPLRKGHVFLFLLEMAETKTRQLFQGRVFQEQVLEHQKEPQVPRGWWPVAPRALPCHVRL